MQQRQTFVAGGSETACPHLLKEEDLPRKRSLNDAQALELFDMVRKGFSNKDIAKKFGIAEKTVGTYYRRMLRERGKEAQRNGGGPRLVVMRNGTDKLTFDVDEGYVGRTKIDGIENDCTFKADSDPEAIIQFDEWLADMSAEREFMDMVERKEPVDEDAAYIATWDTKAAANVLRDYEDNKLLRDVDRDMDVMLACEKRDSRIKELEKALADKPAPKANGMSGTAYVLLAVKPHIKGYGLYLDMDEAFAELDRLNEVASMLGAENAFEIHEMQWR